MGLFRAMNTGATGIFSSSTALETIGDNIANLNTTAFKSTRADQENLFALTLRESILSDASGALNPSQVGLGSAIGAIQRSFTQGATVSTGVQTDLAADGNGFFILADGSASLLYTRDGAFELNVAQQLQSRAGLLVQGWSATPSGDIDTTAPVGALTIPVGVSTLVRPTTQASLDGNLNSGDVVAGQGHVQRSAPLLASTAPATPAVLSTQLTALADEQGAALFAEGDVVAVSNVQKGQANMLVEPLTFTVGADGTTLGDLLAFLEGAVAIQTAADVPPAGNDPQTGAILRPGITIDGSGRVLVASNVGAANAVVFETGDVVNVTAGRTLLTFGAPEQSATGIGASTEFKVFDSLGGDVDLRLRLVQESRDGSTTTWRWYAESADSSAVSKALQTGTLSFDSEGNLVGSSGGPVTIPLADRGAEDLAVTLDLSRVTQLLGSSQVLLQEQNGAPLGVLQDFAIDEDGVITGGFSNGISTPIGQVALAVFSNPGGLELQDGNNYASTSASGAATVTPALADGAGRILSGTLEQSNVELAREFIGLINNSTQFSASSRVITTADELLQELLRMAR